MRRNALLAGVMVLGAAIGGCLSLGGCSSNAEGSGPGITGSYLLIVNHEGFPSTQGLVHLTRDGGFLSSDGSDFGAGGLSTLNTPVYGSWKRTGDRQIKVRTLYIGSDNDDGTPVAIARTTGTFDFDAGFNSGNGVLVVELFKTDQDPLDPNSRPFDTLNGTVSARRIVVP